MLIHLHNYRIYPRAAVRPSSKTKQTSEFFLTTFNRQTKGIPPKTMMTKGEFIKSLGLVANRWQCEQILKLKHPPPPPENQFFLIQHCILLKFDFFYYSRYRAIDKIFWNILSSA